MNSFTIESGINYEHSVRRLTCKGFSNGFMLVKMKVVGSVFTKYAIIDELTGVVLLTANSMSKALFELENYLAPLNQADLNDFLNVGIKICRFDQTCPYRKRDIRCTPLRSCYEPSE